MPMLVTLFGIDTDVSDVQPENAAVRMCVTPFGIITDASDVQPENAAVPMLETA